MAATPTRNRGGRPKTNRPKRTEALTTLLTPREARAVEILCERLGGIGKGELVRGLIYHAADLMVGGAGDPTLSSNASALESLLSSEVLAETDLTVTNTGVTFDTDPIAVNVASTRKRTKTG